METDESQRVYCHRSKISVEKKDHLRKKEIIIICTTYLLNFYLKFISGVLHFVERKKLCLFIPTF